MDKAAEAAISAHLGDKISGPTSTALAGRTFSYTYPSGLIYRISFTSSTVFFRAKIPGMPPPPTLNAGKPYISLPYRARQIRENVFLAHWLVAEREGHVTLVFDLERKTVNCAALMPGRMELFEEAEIAEMWEGGEEALYNE